MQMKVEVKHSRKFKLCIIYHPNPAEIQEQIDKINEILKEID